MFINSLNMFIDFLWYSLEISYLIIFHIFSFDSYMMPRRLKVLPKPSETQEYSDKPEIDGMCVLEINREVAGIFRFWRGAEGEERGGARYHDFLQMINICIRCSLYVHRFYWMFFRVVYRFR